MDEGRYLDFINPQMGRIEILLILGCGHPDFARENLACKEMIKMSWNYVLAGMFTVNRQDYQLFTFQERDNNLIIPAHLCLVYKMYLRNLTLQQLRKQMPIYLWTVQKTLLGRGWRLLMGGGRVAPRFRHSSEGAPRFCQFSKEGLILHIFGGSAQIFQNTTYQKNWNSSNKAIKHI